jgi:hypothetical protein
VHAPAPRLRIGWSTAPLAGVTTDPQGAAAVVRTAAAKAPAKTAPARKTSRNA